MRSKRQKRTSIDDTFFDWVRAQVNPVNKIVNGKRDSSKVTSLEFKIIFGRGLERYIVSGTSSEYSPSNPPPSDLRKWLCPDEKDIDSNRLWNCLKRVKGKRENKFASLRNSRTMTEKKAREWADIPPNIPQCIDAWAEFVDRIDRDSSLLGKDKPARMGKDGINDGHVDEGAVAAIADDQDAHSDADSEAGGDSEAED